MRNVALMLPNSCEEMHGLFGEQFCKKTVTTCVVKSQCKFIIYWGNFQSKKVVLEVTKNWNLGPQGPGHASPGGSARAVPSRRTQGVFSSKTQ